MTERLLIGSGNLGKQREYRELMAGLDLELFAPQDLDPVPPEPEEGGTTFAENASHKARVYAAASGLRTVADDSGLEVDALHGAPGLRSRRFFGDDANAAERNTRLLALLEGVKARGARFVCVAALAWPDGRIELFDGEVRGEIGLAPRASSRPTRNTGSRTAVSPSRSCARTYRKNRDDAAERAGLGPTSGRATREALRGHARIRRPRSSARSLGRCHPA